LRGGSIAAGSVSKALGQGTAFRVELLMIVAPVHNPLPA
jgi:hypothetical protein